MLKHRFVWLSAAFLLSLVLILLLIFWGLRNAWEAHSQPIFDSFLEVDEKVNQDFEKLRELNRHFSQQQACSEQVLKAMRLAEFHSTVLREYGFVINNQLACTTTLGLLEQPIPQTPHDLQSDQSDIQFARAAPIATLEEKEFGMRTRIGTFQAFIRHIPSVVENIPWIDLGLYVVEEQKISPIFDYDEILPRGMLEMARENHWKTYRYWYENGYWVEQFCYKEKNCALVAVNIGKYFTYQQETLLVIVIFVLMGASLAIAISNRGYRLYMKLGKQLLRGLNIRRLECHYQPIFALNSQQLVGCEVLCRWRNERGELVRPDYFINEVEKNGQSQLLTALVIQKSISELRDNQLLGRFRVAINAFPGDIVSGHINQQLEQWVEKELLPLMTIEVTEKEVEDMPRMIKNIERLKKLQVRFAIDDFGTGYSNFQHLEKLPVDYLKIDQSFIRRIETNNLRGQLVKDMVKIADTLKLQTVAEGVEKTEQFELLKQLGVDFSQGYLHARPMPIQEWVHFVAQNGKG